MLAFSRIHQRLLLPRFFFSQTLLARQPIFASLPLLQPPISTSLAQCNIQPLVSSAPALLQMLQPQVLVSLLLAQLHILGVLAQRHDALLRVLCVQLLPPQPPP